jgi:hypothetical protein
MAPNPRSGARSSEPVFQEPDVALEVFLVRAVAGIERLCPAAPQRAIYGRPLGLGECRASCLAPQHEQGRDLYRAYQGRQVVTQAVSQHLGDRFGVAVPQAGDVIRGVLFGPRGILLQLLTLRFLRGFSGSGDV